MLKQVLFTNNQNVDLQNVVKRNHWVLSSQSLDNLYSSGVSVSVIVFASNTITEQVFSVYIEGCTFIGSFFSSLIRLITVP